MCAERPKQGSSNLNTALTVFKSRATSFTPGALAGAYVYHQTGQVWQSLLAACLVGPPTVAAQKVAAQWIELLAPPKSWRRPRRRGT
jgi:hypothetical protein